MLTGGQLVAAARGEALDLETIVHDLHGNPEVKPIHIAAVLGTLQTRFPFDFSGMCNRIVAVSGYQGPLDGRRVLPYDLSTGVLVNQRAYREEWTTAEISNLVGDYVKGELSDEHMAALLGSICVRDLNYNETVALTMATANSGERLDWSSTGKKAVDKHATGGLGDSPSLGLAPLIAAALYDKVIVPMMSGNRLEHTGGTLSKLRSIPGFRTSLTTTEIYDIVSRVGCAIFEQTDTIAPADRKMYKLRDLVACVYSAGLITASIDGKKLAAGVDFLALDTKTGSGAFFSEIDPAREFAQRLANVAKGAGQEVVSLITDMNQPLARYAGNKVEIIHTVEALLGHHNQSRFMDVVYRLAQEMVTSADPLFPAARLPEFIASGQAYERFKEMVAAQGGDTRYLDEIASSTTFGTLSKISSEHIAERIGNGVKIYTVTAPKDGFLHSIALRDLGYAINRMQGPDERNLDHEVGLVMKAELGNRLKEGQPIAHVLYKDEKPREFDTLFHVSPEAPASLRTIKEIVRPSA